MQLARVLACAVVLPAAMAYQASQVHILGKVVLEGGFAPPESAAIEILCGGSARRGGVDGVRAHTDKKGRFSIDIGGPAMVMDASDASGPLGGGMRSPGGMVLQTGSQAPDLMGCELRATLAGYRAEPVQLTGRGAFDSPDVGTILLHRLANVEGRTVSLTSLEAPKDAQKAYEKGREALARHKTEMAKKELRKSVALYPGYAAAWCALGTALEAGDDFVAARQAYGQSLAADPKYIQPHVRLAAIAIRESKWKEALEAAARAIRLDPFDTPKAFLFHALANLKLGNLDAAEKSARELETRGARRDPETGRLLDLILNVRKAGAEKP